jgi:hypothetical protein
MAYTFTYLVLICVPRHENTTTYLKIIYIGEHYALTPGIMPVTATHIVLALATLGDMMAKVIKYSMISHTIMPATLR